MRTSWQAVEASLESHFRNASVDESHGIRHAQAVLAHVEKAIEADPDVAINEQTTLALRLAALLHDADDRKYFGTKQPNALSNAKRIMNDAGIDPAVRDDALSMISFVSCSQNGNNAPPEAYKRPEILWPRWADRLEATGAIGVVRCYQYNLARGEPLSNDDTPRPQSESAVWEVATESRFAAYQESGGSSASMMDHYFDKLLQCARPPASIVRNSYLESEASRRCGALVKVCLAFGSTGVVPVSLIEEMSLSLKDS